MDGPLTNNANFEEQDCKARIKEHEPNQKALDYWELTVSHYRPTIKNFEWYVFNLAVLSL